MFYYSYRLIFSDLAHLKDVISALAHWIVIAIHCCYVSQNGEKRDYKKKLNAWNIEDIQRTMNNIKLKIPRILFECIFMLIVHSTISIGLNIEQSWKSNANIFDSNDKGCVHWAHAHIDDWKSIERYNKHFSSTKIASERS